MAPLELEPQELCLLPSGKPQIQNPQELVISPFQVGARQPRRAWPTGKPCSSCKTNQPLSASRKGTSKALILCLPSGLVTVWWCTQQWHLSSLMPQEGVTVLGPRAACCDALYCVFKICQ